MEHISLLSVLMFQVLHVLTMLVYWIKKNIETLLEARREVVLDVNAEKTKYLIVSCCQNAEQDNS
jgi:hypothetical protein